MEITEKIKTIQTTALLKLAKILRKVVETCSHSDFSENSLELMWKNHDDDDNNAGWLVDFLWHQSLRII